MKNNHLLGEKGRFYIATENGVQCGICPHRCTLGEGQYGICKNRVNRNGAIYSEVYGRLCALNLDPIEKKPLFHFLPGSGCLSLASTGCNLSCKNCQNYNISQAKSEVEGTTKVLPDELIAYCKKIGCDTLAYTYTEPLTYYEYTYDCAKLAHENGIRNLLVSAGYINQEPLSLLAPYIDAANIDLKAFDDNFYRKINHATLEPVLNTLKILKEMGVWVEVTNLLIPTLNDSDIVLTKMCNWLVANGFEDNPLHFSRYFPMYKMNDIPPTPLDSLIKAHNIAERAGMKYVYIGNVGEVDGENTYCPSCKRLLIKRHGFKVLENHLKDGACPYCGESISGVWE